MPPSPLEFRSLLVGLVPLLAACGSTPPGPSADSSSQHYTVELLDDAFVRLDGRRMPWEEMAYAMRQRCREHLSQGLERSALPSIEFRIAADAAPDAVSAATVDRIQVELRRAGVRHITMGAGGGGE